MIDSYLERRPAGQGARRNQGENGPKACQNRTGYPSSRGESQIRFQGSTMGPNKGGTPPLLSLYKVFRGSPSLAPGIPLLPALPVPRGFNPLSSSKIFRARPMNSPLPLSKPGKEEQSRTSGTPAPSSLFRFQKDFHLAAGNPFSIQLHFRFEHPSLEDLMGLLDAG